MMLHDGAYGFMCYLLATYRYNHLEIYNCTATEQYEGKSIILKTPYFVFF